MKPGQGGKPFVDHLKVFGCIVYVKPLNKNVKKFDDQSLPMIFIGYEKGVKGYRTQLYTSLEMLFLKKIKAGIGRIQTQFLQQV